MLEKVVSHFLQSQLAAYVSNFDASKLEISILKGKVSLSDLELRSSAIDALKLPYALKAGHIGELKLSITSWTSLLTSPLEVSLQDVYLLLSPGTEHAFDKAEEERIKQETKKRLLEQWAEQQAQRASQKTPEESDLYSNKSVFRLINNLQLSIGRIHIRFEDSGSSTNMEPFGMGVVLDGLSANSADEKWARGSMSTNKTQARKLVGLQQMGVYCDTDLQASDLVAPGASAKEALQHLRSGLKQEHDFLLTPVSFNGRVAINKRVRDMSEPQHNVELSLPSAGAVLNSSQYHILLRMADYTSWLALRDSWKHMRPSVPLREKPRAWWQFAVDAVLVDFRRRTRPWSWKFMAARRDKRKKYVSLYMKQISGKVSKEEEKAIIQLETELDVADIILYRRIAKAKVPAQTAASSSSWFGGWFGGSKPAKKTDEELEAAEKELVTLLKEDEDFESVDDKSFVATRVAVKLDSIFASLQEKSGKQQTPIFRFAANNSNLRFEMRPAAQAVKVSFDVDHLQLQTLGPNQQLHDCVRKQQMDKAVLTLQAETFPMVEGPVKPDLSARVAFLPLELEVGIGSLLRVQDFFKVPEGLVLDDLNNLYDSALEVVKTQTRAGLEYAIETRKTADIAVDVAAPLITLLENDQPDAHCLVVNLGQLKLRSDLSAQKELPAAQEATLEELEQLVYDNYTVDVVGMQCLVAKANEDWRGSLDRTPSSASEAPSPHHLLSKIEASLKLQRCLRPKDTRLAQFKASGNIKQLQLCASNRTVGRLLAFSKALPKTEEKPQEAVEESPVARGLQRTDSVIRPMQTQESVSQLDILQEQEEDDDIADTATGDAVAAAGGPNDDDDDDDEFVDAEEDFAPSDQKPLSRKSSSKFKLAVQTVSHLSKTQKRAARLAKHQLFVGAFVIEDMSVLIQRHDLDEQSGRTCLALRLSNLNTTLCARTYDMTMEASLAGVYLEDHFSTGSTRSAPVYLIHTALGQHQGASQKTKGEEFVTLSYHYAQPRSAVFASQFNSTESDVAITARQLTIAAHQSSICQLAEVAKLFQDAVASDEEPASAAHAAATASTRADGDASGSATGDNVPLKDTVFVSLRGKFEFQQLALVLLVDQGQLAEFAMSNLAASIEQRPSKLSVDVTMGSIDLTDNSVQDAAQKQILSVEPGEQWLRAAVVMYTDPNQQEENLNGTLKATLGKMRLLGRMRFMDEVLQFVGPIQAAFASTAAAAPEPEPEQDQGKPADATGCEQQDAPAAVSRWKLNVTLNAPTIIVPRSSLSNAAFALDLGRIEVQNAFIVDGPSEFQQFDVSLKNLHAERCDLTTQAGKLVLSTHDHAILEMAESTVIARLVLQTSLRGKDAPVDVSAEVAVGRFSVNFRHSDYSLVLSLLSENLSEKATFVPKAEIAATPQSASKPAQAGTTTVPIDAPNSGTMHVVATWDELTLTLEDDKHARHTPLAALKLSALSCVLDQSGLHSEQMSVRASLKAIEITDLLEGSVNHFPQIVSSSKPRLQPGEDPFLDVSARMSRKTVRVVSADPALVQPLSLKLENGPQPDDIGVTEIKGVHLALLFFKDAETAAKALAGLQTLRRNTKCTVDWAPPNTTTADVKLSHCSISIMPRFLLSLAGFFAVDQPAAIAPAQEAASDEAASQDPAATAAQAQAPTVQPAKLKSSLSGDEVVYGGSSEYLVAKVDLQHSEFRLIEDQTKEDSHAFAIELDVKVCHEMDPGLQVTLIELARMRMRSFDCGTTDTDLEIIPAFALSMKYTTTPEQVKFDAVNTSDIEINLAFRDLMSALAVMDMINASQEEHSRNKRLKPWDQSVYPAPQRKKKGPVAEQEVQPVQEMAFLDFPAINIFLVNNFNWRQTPMLLLSTAVQGTVKNWSSGLDAAVFVKLAAAAFSPRSSAWEPLIVGSAGNDDSERDKRVLHPWPLTVNIQNQKEPKWVFASEIIDQSVNGGKFSSGGGNADCCLDGRDNTFWECGSAKGGCWAIFDLGRASHITGFMFSFFDGSEMDNIQSVLEIGETQKGPWRRIADHDTGQSSDQRQSTNIMEFSTVGRWWKWTLRSKSSRAVKVRSVSFEQQGGGMDIAAEATRRLDLTVDSDFLQRINQSMDTWKGVVEMRKQGQRCEQDITVGTHKLVNLTGRPVAVSCSKLFEPSKNQPMVLEDKEQRFFELRPEKQDTILSELSFTDHSNKPITDVKIISPSKGQVAPEGYTVIPKDLNLGSGIGNSQEAVLYLCYTRETRDARGEKLLPVTDMHVAFGGAGDKRKGTFEPTPDGFTRLEEDLNANGGGRNVHLCIRHGTAAPIVGIAVIYNKRETVPSDYLRINKDTNAGRNGAEDVYVCFRRLPCEPNPEYSPEAGAIPPIVDLKVSFDSPAAESSGQRWNACYNGESRPRDLNRGAGGKSVYLMHSRDHAPGEAVTALKWARDSPDVEKGWFCVADMKTGAPANFNEGNSGRKIFLQYRKDVGASPVEDIRFVQSGEPVPDGYIFLDSSGNLGNRGKAFFVCFKLGSLGRGSWKPLPKSAQEQLEQQAATPSAHGHTLVEEGAGQLQALQLLARDQVSIPFISVQVEGFIPLERIFVDQDSERTYIVDHLWQKYKTRLVVGVEMQDDLKVVTLRSALIVKNMLPIPLQLSYQTTRDTVILEQGQEFVSPIDQQPSIGSADATTLPLFRYWSPKGQQHFYTTDPLDIGELRNTDFVQETLLGYIHKQKQPGTVQLWASRPRLAWSKHEQSFQAFVPRQKETDAQLLTRGFEPVGWVHTSQVSNTLPLYRYHNKRLRDFLLTTNEAEVGTTDRRDKGKHNYVFAELEAYILKNPGIVRVTPAGGQSHQQSEEFINLNCSQTPPNHVLACQPVQGNGLQPLTIHVTHTTPSTWVLEPGLFVHNCLPMPIMFEVSSDSMELKPMQPRCAAPFGEPNDSVGVFDTDVQTQFLFRMALPRASDERPDTREWSSPTEVVVDCARSKRQEFTCTVKCLRDGKERTLCLRLNIARKYGSHGPLQLEVSAPFVIVNETGADFWLKPASGSPLLSFLAAPSSGPDSDKTAAIFAPPPAQGDEAVLVHDQFESKPFTLMGLIKKTEVRTFEGGPFQPQKVPQEPKPDESASHQFNMVWKACTTQDTLTSNDGAQWRELTFHSPVTLVNRAPHEIVVCKDDGEFNAQPLWEPHVMPGEMTLASGQKLRLNTAIKTTTFLRVRRHESLWSSAASMKHAEGLVVLKMADAETGAFVSQAVNITHSGIDVVVDILENKEHAPFVIENHCADTEIKFWQRSSTQHYHLKGGEAMAYALDDPSGLSEASLCFEAVNAGQREPACVKLQPGIPVQGEYNKAGSLSTFMVACVDQGNKLLVLIADDAKQLRTAYGLCAEENEETPVVDISFSLDPGIGISAFVSHPKEEGERPFELAYISVTGITTHFSNTSLFTKLSVTVEDLQVCHQRENAIYPVVICQMRGEEARALLSFCYVLKLGQLGASDRSGDSVEYLSFLLQPLNAVIDGVFIRDVMEFTQYLPASEAQEVAEEIPKYYEKIELHPIEIVLTLTNVEESGFTEGIGSAGLSLLNLSEASLKLNAVLLDKVPPITTSKLTEKLTAEYKSRVIKWLMKSGLVSTVGSLEVFGDPLGSFRTLGSGVKDFFYEPAKAIVHGPGEFGRGVTTGTKKLASAFVGSVTGASSKITGAVASSAAALSFDDDFARERNQRLAVNKARGGFGSGLKTGFTQFGRSLADGVTGIVMQPIKGGREEGFLGGLKGVGKGVAGLVTKPVSGVVDMFSATLAGIENEVNGKQKVVQARLPRHCTVTGVVDPFSMVKAWGQFYIKQTPAFKNEYSDMVYISHAVEQISETECRMYFFLNKLIVIVSAVDNKDPQVVLEVPSNEVVGYRATPQGMEVLLDTTGALLLPTKDQHILASLAKDLGALLTLQRLKAKDHCLVNYFSVPEGVQLESAVAQPVGIQVIEVWENQRKQSGAWGADFLTAGDRPAWSSRDGKAMGKTDTPPHAGLKFIDDWHVDMSGYPADRDNWQYAGNFQASFVAKHSMFQEVRRRRWVRTAAPVNP